MKPVRTIELTHAAPIDRRGHRTNELLLRLDERDRYLVEAAKFFRSPFDREVARQLRTALLRYRAGAWQRDCSEALCPVRYAGTVKAALWKTLKSLDAIPGDRTIRAALAQADGRDARDLAR
jgi:hypothetical protein